ncbi:MAG: hypothetical protein PHV07_04845 [Oscillospiraceae bacterium]|nr:hypothetical protein [Oscillospiraceae bacterium]
MTNSVAPLPRSAVLPVAPAFYSIGVPMTESVKLLKASELNQEADELFQKFKEHADYILKCGLNYPAHEVRYEQSIVAPAVSYLCQIYQLTNDEKYRSAAEDQISLLELFNGKQPDYHLYETAIRHWDDYWFGKAHCYGDTFPHYWSSLTGNSFFGIF